MMFLSWIVYLCILLCSTKTSALQGSDRTHMRRAIGLAGRFLGKTRPNPCVGSVILDEDGNVVSEGAHEKAGQAHAEAVALKEAGKKARNGTAYVTLEPCNHFGRTPPCTQALIRHGVRRVVVGMVDPDPRVAGSGIAALRAHGIQVDLAGDQEKQLCEELNVHFLHRVRQGRPHCTVWSGSEAVCSALDRASNESDTVRKEIFDNITSALVGVDTLILHADQLENMINTTGVNVLTVLPPHVSLMVVPYQTNNKNTCNMSTLLQCIQTLQHRSDKMWYLVNPYTDSAGVESLLLAERVHSSGANVTIIHAVLVQPITHTTNTTTHTDTSASTSTSTSSSMHNTTYTTYDTLSTLPTILHTAMVQLGCNGALLLCDNPAQLNETARRGYVQRLFLTGRTGMCDNNPNVSLGCDSKETTLGSVEGGMPGHYSGDFCDLIRYTTDTSTGSILR